MKQVLSEENKIDDLRKLQKAVKKIDYFSPELPLIEDAVETALYFLSNKDLEQDAQKVAIKLLKALSDAIDSNHKEISKSISLSCASMQLYCGLWDRLHLGQYLLELRQQMREGLKIKERSEAACKKLAMPRSTLSRTKKKLQNMRRKSCRKT